MTSIDHSVDSRENVDRLIARRGSLRLAAVLHGLAFFLAVAAAPHSHLNSLEDLLSDGPSDSGIFYGTTLSAASETGVSIRAARLMDDDPCLACFQNDFQSESVSIFRFTPAWSSLTQVDEFSQPTQPAPPIARSRSRAPPISA